MTPHVYLLELEKWIEDQIDLEHHPPSYNGTQRSIAYRRVLSRLKPILKQIRKIRNEFDAMVIE